MGNLVLKNSNIINEDGTPLVPNPTELKYGELGINYASGVETISMRNSDDEVISLSLREGAGGGTYEALAMHEARNDNPHGVTKAQVGLGNVDNTADIDKPVSTAVQTALNGKLNNAANGGIVNNLTTNSSTQALSAAQGIELKKLIATMTDGAASDLTSLTNRVSAVEEEIQEATSYIDDTLMPLAVSIHNEWTV